MLIKYIIIIFSLFATYRAALRLKDKTISKREYLLWSLFWLVVIIATLVPKNLDQIAQFAGVERGADLAIYLSIIVIFYLLFRILVRLETIEKNITVITRKIALDSNQQNKGSSLPPSRRSPLTGDSDGAVE